jgi:hypothetical protein
LGIARRETGIMTQHLEAAFAEASKLTAEQQDALAAVILEEIGAERHWDDLFSRPDSADLLAKLADRALADHRDGRTRKLDINDL